MICRETIMETDDPSLVVSAVKSAPPPRRGALGCVSLSPSSNRASRGPPLQKKKGLQQAANTASSSSSAHKRNQK